MNLAGKKNKKIVRDHQYFVPTKFYGGQRVIWAFGFVSWAPTSKFPTQKWHQNVTQDIKSLLLYWHMYMLRTAKLDKFTSKYSFIFLMNFTRCILLVYYDNGSMQTICITRVLGWNSFYIFTYLFSAYQSQSFGSGCLYPEKSNGIRTHVTHSLTGNPSRSLGHDSLTTICGLMSYMIMGYKIVKSSRDNMCQIAYGYMCIGTVRQNLHFLSQCRSYLLW